MSWLAPSFLAWDAVALAVLAALHLLARRRPPPEHFPTARFVPARALRLTARGIAPSDLLLFLVRALALVAIASAFAGPLVRHPHASVRRVVVADVSRAVAQLRETRDSVRLALRDGDVLLLFDSTARVAAGPQLDSLTTAMVRGSLSTALLAASRAASSLAASADSLDLVIVSPLVEEELDDATLLTRDAWPGRARLVRVAASRDTLSHALEVEAGDEPLLAAFRLRGPRGAAAAVRVRRSVPNGADSGWAHLAGHVLVHWPRTSLVDTNAGWRRRARVDIVGGVEAGSAVVVAPLVRRWQLDGRIVARWVDGEAAAVEHSVGEGCIRDVGIGIDPASDAPLRPEFSRLASALLAPCGGRRSWRAAPDSVLTRLAGVGALAPAQSFGHGAAARSPWTLWLVVAAFSLLLLEWAVRRSRVSVPA
jgi:aerotolerance regulator-like protein